MNEKAKWFRNCPLFLLCLQVSRQLTSQSQINQINQRQILLPQLLQRGSPVIYIYCSCLRFSPFPTLFKFLFLLHVKCSFPFHAAKQINYSYKSNSLCGYATVGCSPPFQFQIWFSHNAGYSSWKRLPCSGKF